MLYGSVSPCAVNIDLWFGVNPFSHTTHEVNSIPVPSTIAFGFLNVHFHNCSILNAIVPSPSPVFFSRFCPHRSEYINHPYYYPSMSLDLIKRPTNMLCPASLCATGAFFRKNTNRSTVNSNHWSNVVNIQSRRPSSALLVCQNIQCFLTQLLLAEISTQMSQDVWRELLHRKAFLEPSTHPDAFIPQSLLLAWHTPPQN